MLGLLAGMLLAIFEWPIIAGLVWIVDKVRGR